MKFHIGSMIVAVDEIPDYKILESFFRRPAAEDAVADFSWKIEVYEERDWPCEVWDRTDAVWFTGRKHHYFQYDGYKNEFCLKILKTIDSEGLYWLRRDLFGGFGSVSGQQVIHSSAVIYGNKGYIFSAPSETGKTTLFNNLKPFAEQVNDESNWVYQNIEGVFMLVNQNYYFGTSDRYEVPVHGIYLLEQSPVCRIVADVDSMEAFTILLSVHPPFDYFDPFLEERSLAIRHLQKSLPVKKFMVNLLPEELAETIFGDR